MKLLLIFFSYLLTLIHAQSYCRTPSGQLSTCIPVVTCRPAVDILKGPRPLSDAVLRFLRQSQCGLEGEMPFVCCGGFTELTTAPPKFTTVPDPPNVLNHPNLRLLDHSACGPLSTAKIFGGETASVFDHPWMALVVYIHNEKKEFGCGGTIISDRYILTAAHCLIDLPSNIILGGVRVGEHDWSTERDCDKDEDGLEIICVEDSYQDILIQKIESHPDYLPSTLRNDIGLIRLSKAIDFAPITVRPICLPIEESGSMAQETLTVAGWGATNFSSYSTELLMADVSVLPNDECAKAYGESNLVWYKQICAVGKKGRDSAAGDSGGPLQSPGSYRSDVRYIQYGIVSFGIRNYGVYTNVQYYLDWILDTMEE